MKQVHLVRFGVYFMATIGCIIWGTRWALNAAFMLMNGYSGAGVFLNLDIVPVFLAIAFYIRAIKELSAYKSAE